MRLEEISNLKTFDRIQLQNEPFIQNLLTPDAFNHLKTLIENGDLFDVDSLYDTSYLNGTIYRLLNEVRVQLDLLPKEAFQLDMNQGYLVELLEPGDDDYERPKSPKTSSTQGDNGAVVDMRPFNRDLDGVGTRVAVNSEEIYDWEGDRIFMLGTVERLDGDRNSKVNYDGHKPVFTKEDFYIVFGTDEDVKKVRTFDIDDGEGSRVAVLGTRMPDGNDVTKMYYGTIKSSSDFSSIEIEFDTDISGGISRGLSNSGRQLFFGTQDLIIIDGPAAKNDDNSFFLKSIADVLLSTTSKTNFNRAEVVVSLLTDKFGPDYEKEMEIALESKEAFDLFQEILEGLGQMEARRLGISVKPKIETLTPAPAAPKAPRKKKEPVSAEPVEITTPDTSVFQNEDELSSILDEFLT